MIVEGGLNLKDIKKSPELKSSRDLIWGQMAFELMNIIAERSEVWRICLDDLDRHHHPAPTLIGLSYKEFELLNFFMENQGIALSREKILNNVWNYDYYGDSRTIDSHIKKIRHKLGKKGKYIKTMRGIGYKFETK